MRLPPPRATVALAALTVAAWAALALAGADDVAGLAGGFIPERMNGGGQAAVEAAYGIASVAFVPVALTPLSAALIHAGIMHIAFNLLMLGFCGRFVEVALGGRGLVLLYVIGAYAGALGQYIASPHGLVPMVGASGAISALFGAYALLFGERRGRLADHRFGKALQTLWLAIAWIGFQLLVGFATMQEGMAIAIAAHIGGFLSGLAFAKPLLRWRYRRA